MNRFKILKLPEDFIPCFVPIILDIDVPEPPIAQFSAPILTPRRVQFPLFEISTNPSIPLTEVRERRFDLIQRAPDIARFQEISQVTDPADLQALIQILDVPENAWGRTTLDIANNDCSNNSEVDQDIIEHLSAR